jgi:serine/threonine protein kinase
MADLIGQQLGQYKIVELLGMGGMAAVYKARQVSMGRDVALKVIEPTLTGSAEFTKRFEREMKASAMLSHPHILKVFDFGQQNGLVYLVMELLTGGSLADQISVGAMPLPQVTHLLEQIASALDYAHQKGIIHRDLKPQNVLLDESGNAFLTDFGIVKLVDETSALTQKGSVVGTPAYISPEHWLGQPVDYRADIYALGVVLFEMLTGQQPFQGETLYSMMKLHVNELPPSVLERRPGLSPQIEEVLAQALAKNPAQRYSSAGDLATAFKEATTAPATPAPARPPVRQPGQVTPRPNVAETAPSPRQVDAGETSPMPVYGGGAPSGSTVHDTVPIAIPLPAPARPTAPPQTQRQPAKQPPAASANPATRRLPMPLIVGGVAVIAVLIVVVVLIASGGGGLSAPQQTQTQAAILALTPSQTFTPSATVPIVAINATNTRTPTRTPTLTPTFTPSLTFTPTTTPTFTDTPAATLTATSTATETPTTLPTQTPNIGATATALVTATVRAITGNVNGLIRSSERVLGPVTGTLSHNSGDAIVTQDAGLSLQDFVIDARFFNPYEATDTAIWDYGFLFRSEGTGKQYRLEIRSNKIWGLLLKVQDDLAPVVVAKGNLDNLDLTANGSNLLRLVVKGSEAYFYVNEQYVGTLDVSAKMVAGDISIATGILQGDKIVGKATRFENWAIAKIP